MLQRSFMTVLSASLFVSSAAFAGATFELNPATNEILMKGKMVYYGDNVNAAIAAKATKEIQDMWSGLGVRAEDAPLNLTVKVGTKSYKLRAVFTQEIVTTTQAQAMAATNRDPSVNFIRFRKGGQPGDRSYYHGLGANSGVFYESDDIGISTTAAHEFGHGVSLDHPNEFDWRGRGRPAIMCPRGTIVDAQYQWDPNAQAGQPGGTMSPYWRRVTQWDIDNIGLSRLTFDARGVATVGYASNEIETSAFEPAFNFYRMQYEGFFNEGHAH